MRLRQLNRWEIFLLVILVALCIIQYLLIARNTFNSIPSPWQVSEKSPEFSFVTTYKLTDISRREDGEHQFFLILRDNSLIYYKGIANILYANYSLNRLNLLTGEFEWQQKQERPVSGIANNEHIIFFTHNTYTTPRYSGQTLTRPGAILVTAHDIDSGNQLWSTVYEGFAGTSYMRTSESQILIGGHNGHGAYTDETVLNVGTGEILEGEDGGKVGTDIALQVTENLPTYNHMAELTDNVVVLAHSPIIAYDLKIDSIVWQTEINRSFSNIVVSNNVIYFLDDKAILWALDGQTGAALGHVQFGPVDPGRAEPFGNYGGYSIVADGTGVALYFSETHQLFFFHFVRGDE